MRFVVPTTLMALLCLTPSLAQKNTDSELESLRGLQGVEVVIEGVPPEVQKDGLLESEIQAAVERILKSSGIPLRTRSERLMMPSAPYLYVRATTIKNRRRFYVYSVEISLIQKVSLVHRPGNVTVSAVTWEKTMTGSVPKAKISQVISLSIEPPVQTFANDFLRANPR